MINLLSSSAPWFIYNNNYINVYTKIPDPCYFVHRVIHLFDLVLVLLRFKKACNSSLLCTTGRFHKFSSRLYFIWVNIRTFLRKKRLYCPKMTLWTKVTRHFWRLIPFPMWVFAVLFFCNYSLIYKKLTMQKNLRIR